MIPHAAATRGRVRGFAAFIRLSRLKFLAGGIIGGVFGTLVALYERGAIDVRAYAFAQLTITAAHLMTQYANDYFDRESDALTTRTPFSGGSGALVDGSLQPVVALRAALACLAFAACGVVALLATGHALGAALGAACVLLAWSYSAPPIRLLARGLGEANSALVVAILVPLCAYAAQTGVIDLRALASTLPAAAAMFAMMICVQVPDLDADTATKKRNLVVRFGTRRSGSFGIATLVFALVSIGVAALLGAPFAFAAWELVSIVPILWLATAFAALRAGKPVANDVLASRGVTIFMTVALLGVIGYAQAAR